MLYRNRTKYTGVYQRELQDNLFNGKPNICFDFCFKHEDRLRWEKAGLLSEEYSAKMASKIRAERLRSIRHGTELPNQKNQVPLFQDVWGKYKEWAEQNKTRGAYNDISLYSNCLQKPLADKRLNEISAFDLERLKSSLLKKNMLLLLLNIAWY